VADGNRGRYASEGGGLTLQGKGTVEVAEKRGNQLKTQFLRASMAGSVPEVLWEFILTAPAESRATRKLVRHLGCGRTVRPDDNGN